MIRLICGAKTEEDLQQKSTIYISEPKSPKATIIRHGTIIRLLHEARKVRNARNISHSDSVHFGPLEQLFKVDGRTENGAPRPFQSPSPGAHTMWVEVEPIERIEEEFL